MSDSERLDWIMGMLEIVARSASEHVLSTLAIDFVPGGSIRTVTERRKAWRKAIDHAAGEPEDSKG